MSVMSAGQDDAPVLCHRCGAVLTPGTDDLYVIRIEAFADPTPAPVDPHQTSQEIQANAVGWWTVSSLPAASDEEIGFDRLIAPARVPPTSVTLIEPAVNYRSRFTCRGAGIGYQSYCARACTPIYLQSSFDLEPSFAIVSHLILPWEMI